MRTWVSLFHLLCLAFLQLTLSSSTDRLLLVNDTINHVCDRYEAFKKGDFTATASIDASIDPNKGGADAVPTPKISDLISFDEEPSASSSAPAAGGGSLMDDFASLTFDAPAAKSPTSSVGKAPAAAPVHTQPSILPADLFDTSPAPASTSSGAAPPPGFGDWGALQLPMSSTASGSGTSTPSAAIAASGSSPALTPNRPNAATQQQQQQKPAQPAKPADPFDQLDALFGK